MHISPADFEAVDFQELLQSYLTFATRDACSHALGITSLKSTAVQMFVARNSHGELMGCAALKILNADHGEIKSVRTHDDHLRKGVSRALMGHIESVAKINGLQNLYLETHNTPPYGAACRLYENLGYTYCGPFGDYVQNPRNVFMTKEI